MGRIQRAIAIGIATGVAGLIAALAPVARTIEESVGLASLFRVRGPIPAPADVVVVSIDEAAATRMGLPAAVRDWPRSVHATLVDRLVDLGASAIAFDVQFLQHGATDADEVFADSIGRSRRVVLVQRVDVIRQGGTENWVRQNPIPLLAERTAGLAPVPLPDLPLVGWFWSFLPSPEGDELPSLSAVTLQVHGLPRLAMLLESLERAGVDGLDALPRDAANLLQSSDLSRLMQSLRRQVPRHAVAARAAVAEFPMGPGADARRDARLLRALVDLYAGSGVRHLNFYGPPGHVCTIPYDVALEGTRPCRVAGSVVLVGLGTSRAARTDQPDTYHTVYPTTDGVDFSGVEIQATAVANLLDGTTLEVFDRGAFVASAMLPGVAFGVVCYWVRTRRRWTKGAARGRVQAALATVALGLAYGGIVYASFSRVHVVLPLIVPLGFQLPLALVVGLLAPAVRHREHVRAVCLATDAEGSTAIGQRLPHAEYAALMEEYRQMLLTSVRAHGGEPVPPEGDGLICVWRCPSASDSTGESPGGDRAACVRACHAALAIAQGADRFNARRPEAHRLPTRIGLTIGTITVDSDADRGVYEVFGDTINVAARLRDLNRELGSHVLAAAAVVAALEETLPVRPVSVPFTLKGVPSAPVVFELTGASDGLGHPDGGGTARIG